MVVVVDVNLCSWLSCPLHNKINYIGLCDDIELEVTK